MLGQGDVWLLEEIGKSRYAIGDEPFREATEEALNHKRMERTVTGDIVWPEERRPALEVVAEEAADVLGVALSDVRVHGHRLGDRKALVVEWYCRLSDASQRAVALYVGYGSESAVGKTRKRVQAALSQDPGFADAEREILRRLSVAQRVTGDNIASQDSKF